MASPNYLVTVQIRAALERHVKRGVVGATRKLAAVAAAFQASAGNPGEVGPAHSRLAEGMRESVVTRYSESQGRKKVTEPYRAGRNRLPGALGQALARKDLAIGTPDGIFFADTDMLDREARHWRRLNFGVEPRGNEGSRSFQIRFDDRVLMRIGLNGRPRPPMMIPTGFFEHAGRRESPSAEFRGNSQFPFYPTSRTMLTVSEGFEGRQFLDAGLEYLGSQLGPTYSDLLDRWLDSATKRGNAARRALGAR